MWTGLESPNGERLADDRPTAAKMVDDPPPVARELPPRGQIATEFKLPAAAIEGGFVGFAVLGTGERVYSVPAAPQRDISEAQALIKDIAAKDDPAVP